MNPDLPVLFKDLGVAAALGLAATGSALGTGAAAMSAVGAMKKCFVQNKNVPFVLFLAPVWTPRGIPLTPH